MNWISIDDKLPDEGYPLNYFLVVIQTLGGILPKGCYRWIGIASYMLPCEQGENKWDTGNTGYWEDVTRAPEQPFKITHWMPLPGFPGDEVKEEKK